MAVIVKEKEIILIREGVIQSWAKDVFSFGCLLGSLLFNHMLLGDSNIVGTTICAIWLLWVVAIGQRKPLTLDEAIAKLQAMKKD